MTKRLSENDRRAVDLLLDRTTGAGAGNGNGDGNGNGGYVAHAQPATEPGIRSVQKILSLLELMPAAEPPADLMARTLARIDSRVGAAASIHQPHPAAMTDARPHA